MDSLQQYLIENSADDIKETVKLHGRLSEFEFQVQAITGNRYNEYQAACIRNPNSAKKRSFDTKKFNELIVLNHTVHPNFKETEWMAAAKCQTPEQLLYKTLLAGEINQLAEEILTLSGFNQDTDEAVEEVKN